MNNSKLVEKSKTQLAIPDTDKLDDETQIMNDSPKKISGNNSNSQIMKSSKKSSAVKRSRDDKKKHKNLSKKVSEIKVDQFFITFNKLLHSSHKNLSS